MIRRESWLILCFNSAHTYMEAAIKQHKSKRVRPRTGRKGWVLLMTTHPPRAIWQKISGANYQSETSCALSFYSNFFQAAGPFQFKNVGLKQ
jgi:hypothetical protein